jgi:hypothetical protein
LNRGEKDTRVNGRAASLAHQFGISADALSEIEETVFSHLDSKALMIEFLPVWQELKYSNPFAPAELKGRAKQFALADNVARETASRLRPLFLEAASEYAEMLTRTIVDHHQQDGQAIHWKIIANQAVKFCVTLTLWEESARWLYGPLKTAGFSWKDIGPRTRPAYLSALSAWMLVGPYARPSLSTEPEAEGVPDRLRRKIRQIARLAPEESPTLHSSSLDARRGVAMGASGWQGFHEGFMQLAREEEQIERAAPRDRFLRAYCTYKEHPEVWEIGKPEQGCFCLLHTPTCGVWTLGDGVSENFQERFRVLAARAGVTLGSPKDADPEDFWLHRLFLDLRENNSKQLFAASEEGGMIRRVCVASATFCARLERKVLKESGSADRPKLEVAGARSIGKPLTNREQKIWAVIQRGATGLKYCRELSNAGIAPLRRGVWKDCPRKYESAYLDGNLWRHRIQDEKFKIQRKAKLAGLAKLASE